MFVSRKQKEKKKVSMRDRLQCIENLFYSPGLRSTIGTFYFVSNSLLATVFSYSYHTFFFFFNLNLFLPQHRLKAKTQKYVFFSLG